MQGVFRCCLSFFLSLSRVLSAFSLSETLAAFACMDNPVPLTEEIKAGELKFQLSDYDKVKIPSGFPPTLNWLLWPGNITLHSVEPSQAH